MELTLQLDGSSSPNPAIGGFWAAARISSIQTLERKGSLIFTMSNGVENHGLIHGLRLLHEDAFNLYRQ